MLKITDNEFNRLVSFMRERYGINLSHKRTLIEGRLGNMLVERGFKNYDEYLDCCMNDRSGKELDGLLIKLTTIILILCVNRSILLTLQAPFFRL